MTNVSGDRPRRRAAAAEAGPTARNLTVACLSIQSSCAVGPAIGARRLTSTAPWATSDLGFGRCGGRNLAASEGQTDWAADIGTRVFWLALLVGLVVGAIGSGFHLLIDAAQDARARLVAGAFDAPLQVHQIAALAEQIPPEWRSVLTVEPVLAARFIVVTVLVALALGIARRLVRHVAPEAAGSGVQEIEGTLLGSRRLRWRRVLPVKFLGGGLALGTGLVLGREGPTIHMGGAAAAGIARATNATLSETRALLAAGAGAGLAAAFNAPIAGVLFVIEEMRRHAPYSFQGYHAVLIACVAATFVTEGITGTGPELRLAMATPAFAHYPYFLVLGVLLGACGAIFNRVLLGALDMFGIWSARAGWTLVLALAISVATALFLLPAAIGGGEQIIRPLLAQPLGLQALGLLLAVRLAMTLASYCAGTPGGVFAPILGLATVAGVGCMELARQVAPGLDLDAAAFVAAAMAALFTGSVRAPLVGVVLVAELTDAYPALLAITLSTAMASLTAAAVGGRPLYELLLERTLRLAAPARPARGLDPDR